jgi:hypothetical protein
MIGPYETPAAFRMALQAHLRNIAQDQGIDLQRLQRSVAFERLLARLFAQDDPPWLLKGGYALELRLRGRARSTLDLDISIPDPTGLGPVDEGDSSPEEQVYDRLQRAAEIDLGDGFRFLVQQPRTAQAGAPAGGIRCAIDARLAGRTFARFRLDVGLGDAVLDEPDWVEAPGLLTFAGIPAARVALYPVAQQLAEKTHAYTFPWRDRDNTRVKDLVDLVLLIDSGMLRTDNVRRALAATFETRNTHSLPARPPQPPSSWQEPYAALARELELSALTMDAACRLLEARWRTWR